MEENTPTTISPSIPEGALNDNDTQATPATLSDEDAAKEAKRVAQRERLQRAHEVMAERRATGWKPVKLNPVERAKANPNSAKMAIKAHCWTCCGAGADPGVKLHVRDCTVKNCALWPHRPWQTAKGRFSVGEHGQLVVAEGSDGDTDDDNDAD